MLTASYEEADHLMAHRFISYNTAEIGSGIYRFRPDLGSRQFMQKAKVVWDEVCSILVDLGPVARYPILATTSGNDHLKFREFMIRYGMVQTHDVEHLFEAIPGDDPQRNVTFIFHLSRIDREVLNPVQLCAHILLVSPYICA